MISEPRQSVAPAYNSKFSVHEKFVSNVHFPSQPSSSSPMYMGIVPSNETSRRYLTSKSPSAPTGGGKLAIIKGGKSTLHQKPSWIRDG